MYLIFPDGHVETKKYDSYKSISEATNLLTDQDNPFTVVPLREGMATGYAVYANDVGLLIGLPENPAAMEVTGYPELVGVICVVSFDESGEEECRPYVMPAVKKAFERKLQALMAPSN